ncbi:hypothetical protein IL306_002568 [Fusarium sp. DS 682]|nr:hypothetical protein IL306_002568 [Fusarium sp. DS 682]
MSGGGYQNAGSMADARALHSSFSKKSQSTVPKKRTGPSMQEPRGAPGTRNSPNSATGSSFNTPSPANRNYTETLLKDPLNRTPGGILGSGPLDFLRRQDTDPKQSPDPVQGGGNEVEVKLPSTASTAPGRSQIPSKPAQEETEKVEHRLPPTTAAVPKSAKQGSNSLQGYSEKVQSQLVPNAPPAAISEASKPVSNVELLRDLTTDPGQATVQVPSTAAQHPIESNRKLPEINVLARYLQYLKIKGDESEAGSSADQETQEPVQESNAAVFLRYSSGELLKQKGSAKSVVLPPDCKVQRRNSNGKTKIAAVANLASSFLNLPVASSSKPQAEMTESTVSTPTAPQTSPAHTRLNSVQTLAEAKAETAKAEEVVTAKEVRGKHESKGLRPQAPGFVPRMSDPLATFVPTQQATPTATSVMDGHGTGELASTGIVFGSTSLMGHIVTATPVYFANDRFMTGAPTSQLVGGPSCNGTSSAELPLRSVNDKNEAVRAPRKPTKGLGASMWAK